MNTIAVFYKVPRWVFLSEKLPEKYQFAKTIPEFRQFSDNKDSFDHYKVRGLTAKIERFRSLILELRDDMKEPVKMFASPQIKDSSSFNEIESNVRKWLGASGNYDFSQWKEMVENKGVFVFMTSKYKDWSHIDRNILRGLTIYHSQLPIIIINDSDAKKTQSFTLLHELGHLLRKESVIDNWNYNHKIEKWCDQFAASILMPERDFGKDNVVDFHSVKLVAKKFKVSPYACLVRMSFLIYFKGCSVN